MLVSLLEEHAKLDWRWNDHGLDRMRGEKWQKGRWGEEWAVACEIYDRAQNLVGKAIRHRTSRLWRLELDIVDPSQRPILRVRKNVGLLSLATAFAPDGTRIGGVRSKAEAALPRRGPVALLHATHERRDWRPPEPAKYVGILGNASTIADPDSWLGKITRGSRRQYYSQINQQSPAKLRRLVPAAVVATFTHDFFAYKTHE
jgi:hypothetical protein